MKSGRDAHFVVVALAAALVMAAMLLPASVSADQVPRAVINCGKVGKRAFNIKVEGLDCQKAKQVAKEYAKSRDKDAAGFNCSHRKRGNKGLLEGHCTYGEKVVTFLFRD